MTTDRVVDAPGQSPVTIPFDHFHQVAFGKLHLSAVIKCNILLALCEMHLQVVIS